MLSNHSIRLRNRVVGEQFESSKPVSYETGTSLLSIKKSDLNVSREPVNKWLQSNTWISADSSKSVQCERASVRHVACCDRKRMYPSLHSYSTLYKHTQDLLTPFECAVDSTRQRARYISFYFTHDITTSALCQRESPVRINMMYARKAGQHVPDTSSSLKVRGIDWETLKAKHVNATIFFSGGVCCKSGLQSLPPPPLFFLFFFILPYIRRVVLVQTQFVVPLVIPGLPVLG